MLSRLEMVYLGTIIVAMITSSLGESERSNVESEKVPVTSGLLPVGEVRLDNNHVSPMDLQYLDSKLYEKRTPRFFMGTKGKKDMTEFSEQSHLGYPALSNRIFSEIRRREQEYPIADWEKRAPMSFQTTRGKKSLLDELHELENQDIIDYQNAVENEELIHTPNRYFLVESSDYDKRSLPFYSSYGKRLTDKRFRKGYTGLRGKRNIVYASGKEKMYQDTQ